MGSYKTSGINLLAWNFNLFFPSSCPERHLPHIILRIRRLVKTGDERIRNESQQGERDLGDKPTHSTNDFYQELWEVLATRVQSATSGILHSHMLTHLGGLQREDVMIRTPRNSSTYPRYPSRPSLKHPRNFLKDLHIKHKHNDPGNPPRPPPLASSHTNSEEC